MHSKRVVFDLSQTTVPLIEHDINAFNIQTDNFFTNNLHDLNSGEVSPLIGSIPNSVIEKSNLGETEKSKESTPRLSSPKRKSALKKVNFDYATRRGRVKEGEGDKDETESATEHNYDEIRENRLRLLKRAKMCILKKVSSNHY
jgi:hypothetical protein